MALRMDRGRTQSLFEHLPKQTYSWQGQEGTFIGTEEITTREMDIPRSWIQQHLRRLLLAFRDSAREVGEDLPVERIIENERYELLEPTLLRGEFFPRTFVCKDCERFFRVDNHASSVQCPECQSREVVQWSFVELHDCGYLSSLQPPYCSNEVHP